MTTSQQNCLKAVRKIEGTKLEDEKEGVEITVKDNFGNIDSKIFEYGPNGLPDHYEILEKFEPDCTEQLNESQSHCECPSEFDEGEVLSVRYVSKELTLQRVLGALNKKLASLVFSGRKMGRKSIHEMITFIAFGEDWNHSKVIQEDSTYDKITELLR